MSADDQRRQRIEWAEGNPNDGTYEYVTTSDCDGSNPKRFRRLPRLVAEATPWEAVPMVDLIAAASKVDAVRALHRPVPGDEHAEQRCNGCIAGYDPGTGSLVQCAWPCPTIRALEATDGD